MATKRRPKNLGLYVTVLHPDSMDWDSKKQGVNPWEHEKDADGFATTFEMEEMNGENLIGLQVRRGISRQLAAELLRKLADTLEHLEIDLLSLKRGVAGHISDGTVELTTFFADVFDDDGNLKDGPDAFTIL